VKASRIGIASRPVGQDQVSFKERGGINGDDFRRVDTVPVDLPAGFPKNHRNDRGGIEQDSSDPARTKSQIFVDLFFRYFPAKFIRGNRRPNVGFKKPSEISFRHTTVHRTQTVAALQKRFPHNLGFRFSGKFRDLAHQRFHLRIFQG
jgi:hypothetical protein